MNIDVCGGIGTTAMPAAGMPAVVVAAAVVVVVVKHEGIAHLFGSVLERTNGERMSYDR